MLWGRLFGDFLALAATLVKVVVLFFSVVQDIAHDADETKSSLKKPDVPLPFLKTRTP